MGDLISRKSLIENLNKFMPEFCNELFYQLIRNEPTAFDKEKVIAQIIEESHAENLEWRGTSGEVYHHYVEKIIETEDVIEIVEKGGIE